MPTPTQTQRLEARQRPHEPVVMYQKWRDLLFLHWAWNPQAIQQTLPPGLTVDTFEGRAYLGVVPFFMHDVRPRFCPPVPYLSDFMEMNLRTYVYDEAGVPGVWFYSLDAAQWLAVQIARFLFRLPYFYADMRATRYPGTHEIKYHAHRYGTPEGLASTFRYGPAGPVYYAGPGTLDFFLAERYYLFACARSGAILRGRVHHTPYPLQPARVDAWSDALIALANFTCPAREPDHITYAHGVDVDVFWLRPAGTGL